MVSTSEILEKARNYEQNSAVSAETKPLFHATAPVGWLNDPNGFSRYKNHYHLFYQYHPYSTKWGPMHWGHLRSDDLIHWTTLPCVLAPDNVYDKDGCFSGTAMEHDGKHILMYTGVANGYQTQCIAIGDGVNYEKLQENPVIDIQAEHFRDPKIWFDGERFRAVIANREKGGTGEIVEYVSIDLRNWELIGTIDRSDNKLGKMWECPDIFQLGGKKIIVLSTQETESIGREIHPGHANLYLIHGTNSQRVSEPQAIDYGLDFYAPQTMETSDGRRVMIAWANNWENYITPKDFCYSGMMTIPRELSLCGDRLRQVPVRELDTYLKESAQQTAGRVFDLRISVDTSDWFSVKLASDGKRYVSIYYDFIRNTLTVDRTHSGSLSDVLHSRTIDVPNRNGKLDLRVLMDRYIMEVFVNNGEQVLTCLLYTPLDCDGIEYSGNQYSYEAKKYDIFI